MSAHTPRLKRASHWRPITTAPKGDWMLLVHYSDEGEPMTWFGYRDVDDGKFYFVDTDGTHRANRPTHWQPLPRPPERLPRGYSRHG